METLINAGASINIRTEWGTPLIAAVRTGDIRLVRYLVEAGGNPNMWIDNDGYSSPLSQAVYEGHQEICDYLLPFITDPEEIKYAQQELPKAIIRKQRQQNQQLQEFFDAVMESNTTKVRELVTNGLDINSFNEDGETALHNAVERGNVKMIRLLIELGADLNIVDESGRTPSMCSIGIRAAQAWALRSLIRAGANLNNKDLAGYTALSYTVLDPDVPQVFERILLKAGAQYGDWKGTEIYDAARYGNVRLINRLVEKGVDVNKIDTEDGLTCLMKAVQNSKPWAMLALIKAGANVNVRTEDGKTALYFANNPQPKHPVIKKILLKAGTVQ